LSATFTIANNGIIPLSKIVVFVATCWLNVSVGSGSAPVVMASPEAKDGGNCRSYERSGFVYSDWGHPTLAGDERQAIELRDVFSAIHVAHAADADIAISVAYQPWFLWPIKRHKMFRFITRRDQNGDIRWVPIPLDLYVKQR
jgi:hypothetical protein